MATSIQSDSTNPLFDQLSIQKRQAEQTKNRTTLDQADFLNLMMTELKNQNPMEPTDNKEMIAQMAQFSTVSGLTEMQKSINGLRDSLVSNQALEASTLVGRFVMVPTDKGFLPAGEGDRFFGGVELEQSAAAVEVNIFSKAGELVKTIPLGSQQPGTTRFSWDGKDNFGKDVPEGEYNVTAQINADGKKQAVNTLMIAPVDSVTLGRNGDPMKLNVAGMGAMSLSSVKEIL